MSVIFGHLWSLFLSRPGLLVGSILGIQEHVRGAALENLKTLEVNVGQVYLLKHRVGKDLAKALKEAQARMERK